MAGTGTQDARLEAIAAAAAAVLSETEYHEVRTQDIAARVRLDESGDGRSAGGRRSAVWVYNEARSRRVLVALAARHAWNAYLAAADRTPGGPDAGTVSGAVSRVAAALLEIGRFHRASQFLMRQVGLGIGDIATSEKRAGADGQPPSWPGSTWGQVAADGFDGRCSAFADYLAPVLLGAGRAVCPMTAEQARRQARMLSDLAFRALLSDRDGPLDAVSEGLAGYWFERDLARLAGPRARVLLAAERVLAGERPDAEPRAAAAARGALADLLLDYGALNARCAEIGAGRVTLLAGLAGFPAPAGSVSAGPVLAGPVLAGPVSAGPVPGGPVPGGPERGAVAGADPADLRALCDAASRQGLAAQRFGALATARVAFELSRAVAAALAGHAPDEAASYADRADHNLAAVALTAGARQRSAALIDAVHDRRRQRAADGGLPAWRRYSLSAGLRVQVSIALGHPVAAVTEAERLVADRAARLGGTDNASVAAGRAVLGQALLAAGHPAAARYHLEAARRFHEIVAPSFGYQVQRIIIELARAALEMDDPDLARRLLPEPDEVSWIAGQVSVRLAAAARGLSAVAQARCGQPVLAQAAPAQATPAQAAAAEAAPAGATAAEAAAAAIAEFRPSAQGPADPLALGLDRMRAEALLLAGEPVAAAGVLDSVRAAETGGGGPFSVGAALTLGGLARCADAAGDSDGALRCHAELRAGAAGVLDPAHAAVLRADLDQARRLLDAADIDGAAALVAGLLDREPLAHGRPRLEDGHPLLSAARQLAREIGVTVPAAPEQDWGAE